MITTTSGKSILKLSVNIQCLIYGTIAGCVTFSNAKSLCQCYATIPSAKLSRQFNARLIHKNFSACLWFVIRREQTNGQVLNKPCSHPPDSFPSLLLRKCPNNIRKPNTPTMKIASASTITFHRS